MPLYLKLLAFTVILASLTVSSQRALVAVQATEQAALENIATAGSSPNSSSDSSRTKVLVKVSGEADPVNADRNEAGLAKTLTNLPDTIKLALLLYGLSFAALITALIVWYRENPPQNF